MVRNYRRKTTDNKKYTEDNLVLAIDEAKRTTVYRVSDGIPYVTLHSRIKGIRGAKQGKKKLPGPSKICQQRVSFEDLLLSAIKQTPMPTTQKKLKYVPKLDFPVCFGVYNL
ncbi:unnamed protein product [Ceutorhynchus assimilis]|uniref:Uncharacterized protein n=1 Tax=Ceutorhynchus assimilis TaxID=467358 RepID=A0A9N9MQB1_9CUCU|nr:unnamed protein product [Ceutorhynchus assimilis]